MLFGIDKKPYPQMTQMYADRTVFNLRSSA